MNFYLRLQKKGSQFIHKIFTLMKDYSLSQIQIAHAHNQSKNNTSQGKWVIMTILIEPLISNPCNGIGQFSMFLVFFPLSLKKYGGTAVAREAKNLNQENVVLLKSQLGNQD